MTRLVASPVLAHAGAGEAGGAGETAMTIMLVSVLVLIWALVGVVCWIFWRAKKREDAAVRQRADATSGEWRNAPSS